MDTRSVSIIFSLLLGLVALMGVAPTATATDDDCGSACVENCEVGIGTRITATCEVGHSPRTVDTCSFLQGCGDWVVTCTALDRNDPSCGFVPYCAESPSAEVCYDWSRKYCSVWLDNGHWTVCLADRIDLK